MLVDITSNNFYKRTALYLLSSDRMLSESWVGKDVEGSDRDVV
jgi:hypothetical protein